MTGHFKAKIGLCQTFNSGIQRSISAIFGYNLTFVKQALFILFKGLSPAITEYYLVNGLIDKYICPKTTMPA